MEHQDPELYGKPLTFSALMAGTGVRVRFAPSPTGMIHLGGARTALFNFLYSRAEGGRCILRIEDTDKERTVPGAVHRMKEALKWLGVNFDEGPSLGGDYGPYVQSERLNHYQQIAQQLVQREAAYHCFCTKERLQTLRVRARDPAVGTSTAGPTGGGGGEGGGGEGGGGGGGGERASGYDGCCRKLSKREVERKLEMALPYTIRLKVPEEGDVATVIKDKVYGEVRVENASVEDQVLMKTDGFPTYHLANVVDDHLMEISHVLRGEEWLFSTAKHLMIYRGLCWEPPVYAHLPILVTSTGAKLSKRNKDEYLESYRERGYLPESIVNSLALLGWSPGRGKEEIFSLGELVERFSLSEIRRSRPMMDKNKFLWMNKQYHNKRLRGRTTRRELVSALRKAIDDDPSLSAAITEPRLKDWEYLESALLLLKERVVLVPDIPTEASYLWLDPTPSRDDLLVLGDRSALVLSEVARHLEEEGSGSNDFKEESLAALLKSTAVDLGVPYPRLMIQCRLAVTGTKASPGLGAVMELLGRAVVLRRLKRACDALLNHHESL